MSYGVRWVGLTVELMTIQAATLQAGALRLSPIALCPRALKNAYIIVILLVLLMTFL